MATPRRTRRSTRKHAVRGTLTVHELTKAGTSLELEISARGEKIGELEIGRGGLYWRGGRRQRKKRLDWTRFAELMDDLAYGTKRGASASATGRARSRPRA